MMTTWTEDELTRVGQADELIVAGTKADGTPRKGTIIWAVRLGDALYIRSVNGPEAPWFLGTQLRGEGHIDAGGVSRDVTFERIDEQQREEIDAAYRLKYGSGSPVRAITNDLAASTTLRVDPR